MKKKPFFILYIILTAILLTSCYETPDKLTLPYNIKAGAYGLEKAIITNIITKEVQEKTSDDIFNDNTEYLHWRWLFSFSVGIKEDTKFYLINEKCITINEGLAYELIDNDTLKLHFPRWEGYDYGIYDVVIIFGYQKTYG